MAKRTVIALGALLGAVACSLPIFQEVEPPLASETVARDELSLTGAVDGYAALELLRPRWLVETGVTLAGDTVQPVVFLDQTPQGDVGFLRAIPVADIDSVRYIEAARAVARYGRAYAAGIIRVMVTRGR